MFSSSQITYLETKNYLTKVFLTIKIKFCKVTMFASFIAKKITSRKSTPVKTETILINCC